MKNSALFLVILLALDFTGCRQGRMSSATSNHAPLKVKLVLQPSLKVRAGEFEGKVGKGTEILSRFAKLNG
jgi:hypothetical protein